MHYSWHDYSWLGRSFETCRFCGHQTKTPQYKGWLKHPPEDPRAWKHYSICDQCNNFRTKFGFHLTYKDREMLDTSPWCAICGTQEALHVDHCHTTNKVRGYLCANHNAGIGFMGDNITFFHMAIDYLTPPDETTN